MKLHYYGCTKTGLVRERNEDAILMCAFEDTALFLVADGIGGKNNGEIVSGILRDEFCKWWETEFLASIGEMDFPKSIEAIREKLLQINREVVLRFGEWTSGSTVVLLFLSGKNCAIFSSGDSRIYHARGLRTKVLTRDDTVENLPAERACRYGTSATGKLVGAVGINNRLEFSVRTEIVRPKDRFLLCSDGVYRYVRNRKLEKTLAFEALFHPLDGIVEKLCKEVENNGAGDNYSMIIVKIG